MRRVEVVSIRRPPWNWLSLDYRRCALPCEECGPYGDVETYKAWEQQCEDLVGPPRRTKRGRERRNGRLHHARRIGRSWKDQVMSWNLRGVRVKNHGAVKFVGPLCRKTYTAAQVAERIGLEKKP